MTAVPRIVIGTPDEGKTRHNRWEVKDTEGKEGVRQEEEKKNKTTQRRRRETQKSREMRVNPPVTEKER